ncbi:hypothetical protein HDA40_000566 [Hamadaea flava]|uniref:Uncharacterized protein n=1 Tax=Hamadaea flava TaxID=1742688 RepID=A0ABV8M0R8_9ACTN|nr:hypothetical protein [Hamadaea flava]MCP2322059.1 hypothetical protein [Hamadaea flava]
MQRTPPDELIAEAAQNPGGYVYEIDGEMIGDPDGYIPPEAILGAWEVGPDGVLTGEYEPNEEHGPPQDDFSHLTEADHWLDWMGEDPAAAIRESVLEVLQDQVPDASLRWMKIVAEPRFLTAGRPAPDDPDKLIVTRAALALSFGLGVDSGDSYEILWGVFSVAVVGLDEPAGRSRVWFDLWADLDEAEEQLPDRISGF